MFNILTFLSRSSIWKLNFFNAGNRVVVKNIADLRMLRRYISTEKWEFSDGDKGIDGVFHHTVKATEQDHSVEEIYNTLIQLIAAHTNSLFFLTEKTRLL